ncbi:MAG: putative toxin-antitoxin system toxin component, PIN family [bacterium]|nr:putative toxin-antitoxin system toxin component, PIN family [bacterium]
MSGVFFAGPPSRILAAWADGRLDLLATVEILAEYQGVATRLAKKYPSVDAASVIDLVIRESRIVEPALVADTACDDVDDVKFLACAVSGRAECVVSGDRALLRASGHEGIEVVTPRDFLTRLLE